MHSGKRGERLQSWFMNEGICRVGVRRWKSSLEERLLVLEEEEDEGPFSQSPSWGTG